MTLLANFELETLTEAEDLSLNIERQIGNTPLLSFRRLTRHLPGNIKVFAKGRMAEPRRKRQRPRSPSHHQRGRSGWAPRARQDHHG